MPLITLGLTDTQVAMQTALQGIATEATGSLVVVAPIALGVMGMYLVWRYGVRFFKSISK